MEKIELNYSLYKFSSLTRIYLWIFVGTVVLGAILIAICYKTNSGVLGYDGVIFKSMDDCTFAGYDPADCKSFSDTYFDPSGFPFIGSIVAFILSGASLIMFALSFLLIQTTKSMLEGLGGKLND